MNQSSKHWIRRTAIASVRALATTTASLLFLPGYIVASCLPIVAGRFQNSVVRTYQTSTPAIRTPYRAGGTPVSWLRLTRVCFFAQLILGVVLLAPLCVRASGSVTYLLPLPVRQATLLVGSGTHFPLLGRFTSRFSGLDFYRYWAGVSCWVAATPSTHTRGLARIEAHGRNDQFNRAWLTLMDGVAVVDDRLAELGFNAYLTSGVLLAITLLFLETKVLRLVTG